jgi:FG-GAP repeat.
MKIINVMKRNKKKALLKKVIFGSIAVLCLLLINTPAIFAQTTQAYVIFEDSQNNNFNGISNNTLPAGCTSPVAVITKSQSHGTASVVDDTIIIYTPTPGYIGGDTMRYVIRCDATESDTAKVYISVVPKPDNISDVDCYIEPAAFEWGITEVYRSPASNHHVYGIPLVGDINGDGIPDIVTVNVNNFYTDNNIHILWGHDQSITDISLNGNVFHDYTTGGTISPYAMCKLNISGVDRTVIFVVTDNCSYLRAVDLNTGEEIWATNMQAASPRRFESVGIADFNNDGTPEVYLSNRVYNATNGALIASGGTTTNVGNTGNTGSNWGSDRRFTIAADVIGDANLELIAGGKVYAVDFTMNACTCSRADRINK